MENPELKEKIKLTQYSRGAGCGCKISPKILEEILDSQFSFPGNNLIVGNNSGDDAAVYDLGNGQALISTTDFFMPIVDDAFDFGRVAAANAISDVYAMGGKPVLALAILGWPVDHLPASLAKEVMEGAKTICSQAGIALAGGHSIDSAEPFFGLSVNGVISINHLKRNDTAKEGDVIFLTKPIGVGILSTAQKRGVIEDNDLKILIHQLTSLNSIGSRLGEIKGVTAMTDVTGFGLAGHLSEMAEGSGLSAQINYPAIPIIEGAVEYLSKRIVPDATYRNWNSYSNKISFEKGVNVMEAFSILPDPQTNGGLLIAVDPGSVDEVKELFRQNGLEKFANPVGRFVGKDEKVIHVLK
ncbi:selenide, water dikinase SelD [Hanamia caeni]|uniref:Selenide, water dikinase n=1 Tax=Hanamia caeni TaxID=2294116 RepID=A0A3M9N9X8_9BACT|nr:selenide, water dikinase SelD [Hanamia caeni]RNI34612.1 selenide, water dikinase SelD [Hanamia caeni]